MNELIDGKGYTIIENCISNNLTDSLLKQVDKLYPVRASSKDMKYAERDDIKQLKDISVWWSQMLTDWDEVIEINNIIHPHVKQYLAEAELYASDMVTINAKSEWMNPHVDTPHRFSKYNLDKRLLGIQCIVSLNDLSDLNGVTGVVPESQHTDFPIEQCYRGFHTPYFLFNFVQPELPKGSVLLYNCRVLHSSMPNPSNFDRPALLFNYLHRDIIDDIKIIDNIWKSND